jgi:hypothetical protein
LEPDWLDLLAVLCVFWAPPAGIVTYLILREWRRLRRELRALKLDQECSAHEGYPPPGPPTTDSLSDDRDTLETPPTAEPR